MKITAEDLMRFGVIDEIVPEPVGGAHRDPAAAIAATGTAIGDCPVRIWAGWTGKRSAAIAARNSSILAGSYDPPLTLIYLSFTIFVLERRMRIGPAL